MAEIVVGGNVGSSSQMGESGGLQAPERRRRDRSVVGGTGAAAALRWGSQEGFRPLSGDGGTGQWVGVRGYRGSSSSQMGVSGGLQVPERRRRDRSVGEGVQGQQQLSDGGVRRTSGP
jgi:hypothetical protein